MTLHRSRRALSVSPRSLLQASNCVLCMLSQLPCEDACRGQCWQAKLLGALTSNDIPVYPRTFAGRYRPDDTLKGTAFDKIALLFQCGSFNGFGGNRGQLEREFYKHVFEAWRRLEAAGCDGDGAMVAAVVTWYCGKCCGE
jgi:hypothetical protein